MTVYFQPPLLYNWDNRHPQKTNILWIYRRSGNFTLKIIRRENFCGVSGEFLAFCLLPSIRRVVDGTFTSGGLDLHTHKLFHWLLSCKFIFSVLNFCGWSWPRNLLLNSEIFPIYGRQLFEHPYYCDLIVTVMSLIIQTKFISGLQIVWHTLINDFSRKAGGCSNNQWNCSKIRSIITQFTQKHYIHY